MKKTIFLINGLAVISVAFLCFNHMQVKSAEKNAVYDFKTYTTDTSGIESDTASGVSFNGDTGDVAYASNNGLSVGFKNNDGDYSFKNFNPENTQNFHGLNGSSVHFSNSNANEKIIYSSHNEGASIGTPNGSKTYSWQNFNTDYSSEGITSNKTKDALLQAPNSKAPTGLFLYSANPASSSAYDQHETGGLSVGYNDNNSGNWVFKNYRISNSEISSNYGQGVAITSNNVIAYAGSGDFNSTTLLDGGLSIGTPFAAHSNGYVGYSWTTYDFHNVAGFGSSFIDGVAIRDNGEVAVSSKDSFSGESGGITVGIPKLGGGYNFTHYTTTNGLGSNEGEDVAFTSDGNLVYTSKPNQSGNGGGISLGSLDKNGKYHFHTFNSKKNNQILSDSGNGVVSVGGKNSQRAAELGYVSDGGGLTIGTRHSLSAMFNTSDLNYTLMSNGRYRLNALNFSFSFNLENLVNANSHVKIIISQNQVEKIGIYITADGNLPANPTVFPQEYHLAFSKHTIYSVSKLMGESGLAPSKEFTIKAYVGTTEGNLDLIGNASFITPDPAI